MNLFRPDQLRAKDFLDAHASQQALAIQMYTGGGKTRMAAYDASLQSGHTVIAFPFYQLLYQFLNSTADLNAMGLQQEDIGIWLPKSAFVSHTRVEAWRAKGLDIEPPEAGELCDEYLERHQSDDLVLSQMDICLTNDCSKTDNQAAWQRFYDNTEQVKQSKITLCTHTALIIEAINGRYLPVKPEHVIIDEADQLHVMALLFFNKNISAGELAYLKKSCKISLCQPSQDNIAFLEKRIELYRSQGEDKDRLDNLYARLQYFKAHLGDQGCGGRKDGSWGIEHHRPSRVISRIWRQYPTLFLSATLSTDNNSSGGMHDFYQIIGAQANEIKSTIIEPEQFGQLYFNQYRLTPDECDEFSRLKEDHAKLGLHYRYPTDFLLTRDVIHHLRDEPTLVILPSMNDLEKLQAYLPSDLPAIIRRPKESLKKAVKRFEESDANIFIIYGGYIGLDIKRLRMKHLVLPRIPFLVPSEILVNSYSYANDVNWLIRRLMQIIGRIIRRPDDISTLWMLDGRFPVHNNFMEVFRGNNGYFSQHVHLDRAIAERFYDPLGADYGFAQAKKIVRTDSGILVVAQEDAETVRTQYKDV